jgi:hypothetical protein
MVCGNDTNRITYVKERFFHSFNEKKSLLIGGIFLMLALKEKTK